MQPRLTLVTHVDWGHIRQRPQQMAVALASHYRVTVISPVTRKRSVVVESSAAGVNLVRLWRLPGSYRSAAIARANASIAAAQCASHVRNADVVVVTSPELWPWVAPSVGSRTLVYDCMDDALAFDQDGDVRAHKARWERDLVERSNAVVCTSHELAARLVARGASPSHPTIVPNGWDPRAFPVAASSAFPSAGRIELVYFGTIGRWLDIDALREVSQRCPDVAIRLIGPTDGVNLRDLDFLRIEPPVAHGRLAQAAQSAHALLLPFRVDELTRAVDPVKLYEYIALGKPILAAYWPALDRFVEFVTFYRDGLQLADLVNTRAVPSPPTVEKRASFLAAQSWQARAVAFAGAIDGARRALERLV